MILSCTTYIYYIYILTTIEIKIEENVYFTKNVLYISEPVLNIMIELYKM